MISFKNDYAEGAHPKILEALVATNLEQTNGYGEDPYCKAAADLIRAQLGKPQCQVVFLSGGTQANLTVISHLLRPYQAVISTNEGHVVFHETGAIEATGHKVIQQPVPDGKLTPAMVEAVLEQYNQGPHVVQPKLVYISQATETGTLYTKQELMQLYQLCKAKDLYLYIDGARLGSALAAQQGQLALSDYAEYADAFTIGGTKNGALFGEALVIPNNALAQDIRYSVKQKGGLLAKGRMLGIQFQQLFTDNLYLKMAEHANTLAYQLRDGLQEMGFSFAYDSPSNQQFVLFSNAMVEKLSQSYELTIWGKQDTDTVIVRLVTSWATKEQAVQRFLADCRALKG